MQKPAGHNEASSLPSMSSYGLHSAHPFDASLPVLRGVTSTVAQNAKTPKRQQESGRMSYWRAGASQMCKNMEAPKGIVANFLFGPQYEQVWMKKLSGHSSTLARPSVNSYGLHSAHPSDAVSPVLRGVSAITVKLLRGVP